MVMESESEGGTQMHRQNQTKPDKNQYVTRRFRGDLIYIFKFMKGINSDYLG